MKSLRGEGQDAERHVVAFGVRCVVTSLGDEYGMVSLKTSSHAVESNLFSLDQPTAKTGYMVRPMRLIPGLRLLREACFDERVFSQSRAPFAILAKLYPRKTHSRHAQARRHSGYGLLRARHASVGAQPVAFGGAGGLHTLFRWPLDRHGGLEHGAEGFGPSPLARTVNGKVSATSAATCAGGAGAVLDYFVLSEAMAQLVQQVKVVDNSPTTPHSPVSLTLTATSWGHRVLTRGRPKPSPRRCQWVRNARRSNSNGPGLQRIFLSKWSWPGWSGCAQQKLLGAGSTISAGPNAFLFWGGAKGWSSSTFPSARQRATTRGDAAAKRPQPGGALRRLVAQVVGSLAAWRKGQTRQGTFRSVNSLASILLPDLGPWDPGWDFPSQEALAHTLRKAATCGDWTVQVTRVMGFHQMSYTTSSERCGCGFGAWLEAMGTASLPGVGRSSAWLLQGWLRRRRCRWTGRAAALGSIKWGRGCRSGWIRAEPTPSSSPTRRMWESPCQDLHSKRSTMCARQTSTPLEWVTTASTPRQFCSCLSKCEYVCRLGTLDHGGGSEGAAAVGGFLVTRPGKVLRARRARPPLGKVGKPDFQRNFWLVGALHTKAGVFSRPTNAPPFHSGPLGPFFQVAVGPEPLPNSCWQLSWKQRPHASPLTRSGTWSTTFRGTWRELPRWCKSSLPKRPGFWWKASRHATCLSPRANQKSSSMARTSSSVPFCSSWRCLGSTSATRPSWAGGGGPSSSRGGWRGAAKRTKRVRQQRQAGAHTRNLTLTGSNAEVLWGFRGSGLHSDTAPNPSESMRPKPLIGSAEDKTQPQRCWPTPRQRGQKTSIRPFDIIDKSFWLGLREFWEGTLDLDTMQACAARLVHCTLNLSQMAPSVAVVQVATQAAQPGVRLVPTFSAVAASSGTPRKEVVAASSVGRDSGGKMGRNVFELAAEVQELRRAVQKLAGAIMWDGGAVHISRAHRGADRRYRSVLRRHSCSSTRRWPTRASAAAHRHGQHSGDDSLGAACGRNSAASPGGACWSAPRDK